MTLALILALTEASACGGFFCNPQAPIEQAGERIIFHVDKVNETVETHVEVAYEGPAEKFAWIVPAPAPPEPFLSPVQLFDTLETFTAPFFRVTNVAEGDCDGASRNATPTDNADTVDFADTDSFDSDTDAGVVVIAAQVVGAYDTVTLQATSTTALLDWLQANEYDLPDDLAPSLDPYIAENSYFLAIRLTKGAQTGALRPLGLRYAGTEPVIPIQLTRIAAQPDMPITVWTLGDARAVPKNYLHVTINEAAYDWLGRSRSYNDLVTRAANEAGGQAFATDFAGRVGLSGAIQVPTIADGNVLARLGETDHLLNFLGRIQSVGVPLDSLLASILEPCLSVVSGESLDIFDVVADPASHQDWADVANFDPAECMESVHAVYAEPFEHAVELLSDNTYVTRLTSSVSPDEMTADPLFVFNDNMPTVASSHEAIMYFECGDGLDTDKSPRRLELPDGNVVPLPSMEVMAEQNISYLEWVGEQDAAILVESTSSAASPVPIIDNRDEVRDALLALAEDTKFDVGGSAGAAGCSCSSSGGLGWAFVLLPLALVRRRD